MDVPGYRKMLEKKYQRQLEVVRRDTAGRVGPEEE
jgi:hypothetical protein